VGLTVSVGKDAESEYDWLWLSDPLSVIVGSVSVGSGDSVEVGRVADDEREAEAVREAVIPGRVTESVAVWVSVNCLEAEGRVSVTESVGSVSESAAEPVSVSEEVSERDAVSVGEKVEVSVSGGVQVISRVRVEAVGVSVSSSVRVCAVSVAVGRLGVPDAVFIDAVSDSEAVTVARVKVVVAEGSVREREPVGLPDGRVGVRLADGRSAVSDILSVGRVKVPALLLE